jgi:hypothetical protein
MSLLLDLLWDITCPAGGTDEDFLCSAAGGLAALINEHPGGPGRPLRPRPGQPEPWQLLLHQNGALT